MSEAACDLVEGPRSEVHHLLDGPRSEAPFVQGDFPIDENVAAKFPNGTRILSASRAGTSAWTLTARVNVELPDGTPERYFLKCSSGRYGRLSMEGEFDAMSEIHKTMPEIAPTPYSWGKFKNEEPETYFVLFEYIDMSDRVPEPNQLCSKLAKFHRTSVSPTGKFGFQIPTCNGRIPQDLRWQSSWTTFFTQLLQHAMKLDFELNEYWENLDKLEKRLLDHAVSRLIGNLERDGRTVKPCLIHGDLWEGNTGTSYETGNILIFDSGAYYAHNELEIGIWRCDYNKIHNRVYTRTYLKHFGPSEPKEEWDDRNRMYCIYFNILYSANHLDQGTAVRQQAYEDMYYLIDKYAPFPSGEGPPRIAPADRASLSAERDHNMA